MSAFPFSSSSSSSAATFSFSHLSSSSSCAAPFSFTPSSSSYSSAPSNPPTSASTPSFSYGFTSNSSNSSFSFTPSSSSYSSAPSNPPTSASTPSFSFGFTSNSSNSSFSFTPSSSSSSSAPTNAPTFASTPSFSFGFTSNSSLSSTPTTISSAAPFSSSSPLFGNLSNAPFSTSQLFGTSSFSSGVSTTPSFSLSPIRASSSASTPPAFSPPPLFSSTSASSFSSSFRPFPKTSAPSASAPLSLSTPSSSIFTFSFSTPSPASGFSLSSSLLGATSGPSTGFTSTTTSASAASSGATTSFPSFSLSTKESAATTGSSTAPVFDFSMSASAGLSTEGAARISFFTSSATTTQPLSLVSAPSSGRTSSTVRTTQSSAPKLPSEITGKTVEEVTEALARAGLESSNLIVGIDFTKSNEWTGKRSFNNRSLHYIGDRQNLYEQAISIIGRTLCAFDEDNLIPCFGFGDAFTCDKDVFSFYPDGRFCYGFEEALERYREIVPHLRLAGPTSFAPVIEMAITIVEQSGGQYYVLVIITDGQVTRSVDTSPGHLSPQEKDTMDAIVRASEYPLSIILVGVGDGPWDTMKEFDDNIPARAFDNFQFVNFTEIMLKSVPLSKKETEFALAALMKIPSQYKATIELKILGRRTGNSLERVSLPPNLIDGVPSSFSSFKPSQPTYCPSYETPVGSSPPVGSTRNNQDCPICLTNPKDMAFGCGHQTCSECAPSLKSCPICRSPIQIRIKLY